MRISLLLKGVEVPKFVLANTPGVTFETRVILKKEKWVVFAS